MRQQPSFCDIDLSHSLPLNWRWFGNPTSKEVDDNFLKVTSKLVFSTWVLKRNWWKHSVKLMRKWICWKNCYNQSRFKSYNRKEQTSCQFSSDLSILDLFQDRSKYLKYMLIKRIQFKYEVREIHFFTIYICFCLFVLSGFFDLNFR